MKPPRNSDLARVTAESQQHILRSRADCEDGAEHVRSSREAVDRSLRLLRQPVHRGVGGEQR